MDRLRNIVQTHPAIDNHAHNLLRHNLQDDPKKFLSVTSEAQDDALEDSVHALAHLAAKPQLRDLYECEDDDWGSLMTARSQWLKRTEDLHRNCFKGIHAVLMDDGLDAETVYPYDWHNVWTKGETKRIVRIETVAESIMREVIVPAHPKHGFDYVDLELVKVTFEEFARQFGSVLDSALADEEVVGFKSIVCYRSGLAVDLGNSPFDGPPLAAFSAWLEICTTPDERGIISDSVRLDSKPLNDWLVISTLLKISRSAGGGHMKPIQFHTGLGDNDIHLPSANPAHLQNLISHCPQVPIVLLHGAYPYTREAGYLATVYKNVYLDLGLVFPMVSREGQEAVLLQAMELTPCNKLLFSTDGHWFPETYYLAARQFRDTLAQVLVDLVAGGSLSQSQAIQAAKDILFNNANRLYNLKIDIAGFQNDSKLNDANAIETSQPVTSSSTGPMLRSRRGASDIFRGFLAEYPDLAFIYVQWFDYMGTMRARILPVEEFRRIAEGKKRLSMSRGNTGTLQNDFQTTAVNTTGVVYIAPDLGSLRPTHRLDTLRVPGLMNESRSSATVMASWWDEAGRGHPACPRETLISILEALQSEFGIDIKLGFEMEVTFLPREKIEGFVNPVTSNHAWSTMSPEQWVGLGAVRDIYDGLRDIGVEVQQMHAESGKGQYEFALPPEWAMSAVDTLLQCRQVIRQISLTRGLRATFHPGYANGAHAHISLNPATDAAIQPSHEWSFFAGILAHMKAVTAFTLSEEVSYSRVVPSHWAGGIYVAWGTQNRETPLRRVNQRHWEYRALDGMANQYLAMAAVLGAGLLGLREGLEMKLSDCAENPSHLTDDERLARGIEQRIPHSLEESLNGLRADSKLVEVMGESLVNDYITMKNAEMKMLGEMDEEARHDFLVERY